MPLGVEEAEQHLEERRAPLVSFRLQLLNEPLERHVLVRVGTEAHLPHPPEQFPERRLAGEVGAQHQRVDEEPDQPFEFRAGVARDGRADDDVLLSRVAVEQHVEGREQGHVERNVRPPAQFAQGLG